MQSLHLVFTFLVNVTGPNVSRPPLASIEFTSLDTIYYKFAYWLSRKPFRSLGVLLTYQQELARPCNTFSVTIIKLSIHIALAVNDNMYHALATLKQLNISFILSVDFASVLAVPQDASCCGPSVTSLVVGGVCCVGCVLSDRQHRGRYNTGESYVVQLHVSLEIRVIRNNIHIFILRNYTCH